MEEYLQVYSSNNLYDKGMYGTQPAAYKFLDHTNNTAESMKKEVEMLRYVACGCVVAVLVLFINNQLLYRDDLIPGDLRRKKRFGGLSLEDISVIIHGVALSVSWLHDKGIIHRDIKLANFLVSSELHIKIADLGFAKHFSELKNLNTAVDTVGTYCYLAPELLPSNSAEIHFTLMDSPTLDSLDWNIKKTSFASDVFALGLVIREILTGKPRHGTLGEQLRETQKGHNLQIPDIIETGVDANKQTPKKLIKVITNCLATNVAQRCEMKWVMEELDEFRVKQELLRNSVAYVNHT
ncbi:Protein kinase domain [Pelomyxa schiedti]|nr:Protein kinase domain [Pelomyxa schiedti]